MPIQSPSQLETSPTGSTADPLAIFNADWILLNNGLLVKYAYPAPVAGENLAAYAPCCIKSDGKVWRAQSTTDLTLVKAVGINLSAVSTNDACRFVVFGCVTNAGWSFTPGDQLWVSASIGTIQVDNTMPIVQDVLPGSAAIKRYLGEAISATTILVRPAPPLMHRHAATTKTTTIPFPFVCTTKTIFDGLVFDYKQIITKVGLWCEDAPLGANLIVTLLVDGVDSGDITLTAGANYINSGALSVSITTAQRLGLRIKQIGSDGDHPGQNLIVTLHHSKDFS